jgi:serine/threonine protein kinase
MIYLLEANDASKKLLVVKEFFPKGFVIRGENDEVIIKPSLSKQELKSFYFMKEIFIGEAQNLVKVTSKSHSNIVTFFALEENKNNTTYFIMNYEEGISLKEYLAQRKEEKKEKLSNSEIFKIAIPLLSGLEQIHKVDVYHQDIKPENILIREDGSPILLDFGASVILYDKETKKYFNAATPRYAAIEQINVDNPPKIDQTSDIYAMGVLLYKLITDTFPPKSKERLDAIVKGKKDPYVLLTNQKLNGYDSHLLKAVDKALQISQEDRFQSAQQFIDALKNKKKLLQYVIIGIIILLTLIYFLMPTKRGKVKLHVGQKGYSVYVDGSKIVLDKDRTTVLDVGKHKVIVTKDGYIPYEKSISVKSNGMVNLSAELTPMQQVVTIETNVDNATIVLNGRTLKKNIFTARYGEEYKLKVIAKDHETIEKEIGYETLFQNDFKLYYKLPVNKIKIALNVVLSTEMGITKIKVNDEPLRDKVFIAKKGKTYKITVDNPYYEPLQVERTFKELFSNPQQTFVLSPGEGEVTIQAKPESVKVTAYQMIDDQEIKLNKKPYSVNDSITVTLPAANKVYLLVSKEGYKSVRSRIFAVRHASAVTKQFDLSGAKEKGGIAAAVASAIPYEDEMVQVRGTNFKVSKYEITYEAFARFLNSSKVARKNRDNSGHKLYSGKIFRYIIQHSKGFIVSKTYKNYPITHITWYGAKAYVRWLSAQTKKRYTLPTQLQWTQMAQVDFSANRLFMEANFDSGVLFQKGMKEPNRNGIYDLFGNVFEWTNTSASSGKHIIKGGSYRSKRSFLMPHKSSNEYDQNSNRADIGFRIIEL